MAVVAALLMSLVFLALTSADTPAVAATAPPPPPPGGTCPPVNLVLNTGTTLYQFDPLSGAQVSAVPLAAPGSGQAYGDIAYDDTGTTLYGITYPSSNVLYTIDPATGTFSHPTPLVGAAFADVATEPLGSTGPPGSWNGLSAESNGNLLLGSHTTNWVYDLDPVTGRTTHFAAFPTGIVSSGDFLTLPDGQILAVGINYDNPGNPFPSIFYLIDPTTRAMTEIGTGPWTFCAAQSGGNIYLATSDGAINSIAISALPATANSAALPTQRLSDPALPFFGATSVQDAGTCNVPAATSYTVAKTASTVGPVMPGATVIYTLTVTNTGTSPYPPLAAASVDTLFGVTDDAHYVPGSVRADAGSVTVVGNTLSWIGPLAVAPASGSRVTITYQVKVNNPDTGDGMLLNSVAATAAGGSCATAAACTSKIPVQSPPTATAHPSTHPRTALTVRSPTVSAGAAALRSADPLARTGSDTRAELLLAALLLTAGLLLVVAGGHRRRNG